VLAGVFMILTYQKINGIKKTKLPDDPVDAGKEETE